MCLYEVTVEAPATGHTGVPSMRTHLPGLALVAVMVIALSGCASAGAPTWTFGPGPGTSAAPVAEPAAALATPAAAAKPSASMAADAITIEAFDLGFRPAAVTVAAPGMYELTFKNTGSTAADITFSDGTRLTAEGGQTATGMVTVPAAGLTFICSIPGHAPAGMTGAVT